MSSCWHATLGCLHPELMKEDQIVCEYDHLPTAARFANQALRDLLDSLMIERRHGIVEDHWRPAGHPLSVRQEGRERKGTQFAFAENISVPEPPGCIQCDGDHVVARFAPG